MHLLAVGFAEPDFHGQVLKELQRVREMGLIRLIDLQFIWKDENGDITALEATDLSEEERIRFGAVVGGLIGLGAAGEEGMEAGIEAGALSVAERDYGMTDKDIKEIADAIPTDSAAAIMLFEHLWAIKLKEALLDVGAIPLAQGIITPESLMMVGAELAAAVEAAEIEG